MRTFMGVLLGHLLLTTAVLGQGQLVFANSSATTITNAVTGQAWVAGPNSRVAIYAAAGFNQPQGALLLQPGAVTNLFFPGRFQGGNRTLSIPPGPATVQVRAWGGEFPSYEAAEQAVLGGNYVALGHSFLLNIDLTAGPTPPPTLIGAGLNPFHVNTLGSPGQRSYVRWGNTPATRIFTNNCSGTIGLISGTRAFRFGLYVGPLGSPANSLIFAALATNSAIAGQFGTPNPTSLSSQFQPGVPLTFQVRGWPLEAGATFEEALNSPVPGPLGVSDLGYFTPSIDTFTAPLLFGTGPGQVSGFELRGLCPEVAIRRMAPDGPLYFTRFGRDDVYAWTNVLASNATYRFAAASNVTGPYANWTTVTANTSHVVFTNPYSGPSLFFKVEWTHAPAPQPLGTWDYQAFDAAGAVMAAGVFTFTSNVPGTVTRNFSRIQTSGPVNLHPAGPGTLEATSIGSSNVIEMVYSSEFRLRGQMVGDYYAGDWFGTDYIIFIPEDPPPPGSPIAILHTGRFVAKKRF